MEHSQRNPDLATKALCQATIDRIATERLALLDGYIPGPSSLSRTPFDAYSGTTADLVLCCDKSATQDQHRSPRRLRQDPQAKERHWHTGPTVASSHEAREPTVKSQVSVL